MMNQPGLVLNWGQMIHWPGLFLDCSPMMNQPGPVLKWGSNDTLTKPGSQLGVQ